MKRSASPLFLFGIFVCFALLFNSCKKEPGEGGQATIKGKVWVKNYNSDFSALKGEYPGYDVDVYIVYGDETGYSDRTRTDGDGNYEFRYLRKGDYKIYVYSQVEYHPPTDPEPQPADEAIVKEVNISKRKEVLNVPTITIKD